MFHYYLKTIGRASVSRISRVSLRCTCPQLHMHRWPMSVAHALTYIPLKTANRAFMVARTIQPLCVQNTRSVLKGSPPPTPNPTPPPPSPPKKTKKQLAPPLLLQSFFCPFKESQDKNEDRDKSFSDCVIWAILFTGVSNGVEGHGSATSNPMIC